MTKTYRPPADVARAAREGMELRASMPPSKRCCTPVGVRRGVQLSNREPVSLDIVKRMYSYFRRHEVDSKGKGWGVDSKGWQAWLLWGGWEGYEWVAGILGKTMNPAKVGPKRAEAIAEGFKYVALKGNKIVAYADTKAEAQSVGTPEKLPTIPARYLKGLNKKDKVKRVLEILKERESPTYKPLPSDKGVKTKRSGWAGKFERKYGRPGKNVADVAKLTGIKKSILDEVYRKGLAAWSTGGHRPGASQHAWALARVYSFVLGGPTATGPDRYLAVRAGLLKNPLETDYGQRDDAVRQWAESRGLKVGRTQSSGSSDYYEIHVPVRDDSYPFWTPMATVGLRISDHPNLSRARVSSGNDIEIDVNVAPGVYTWEMGQREILRLLKARLFEEEEEAEWDDYYYPGWSVASAEWRKKNPASPDDPPGIAYVKDLAYKLETERGLNPGAAMGIAWSIACKYKRDDIPELDDHCKRPPEDYL